MPPSSLLRPARVALACAALTAVTLAALPREARAFCGFYVAGADSKLYNHATVVVLMREGLRTVLSMQNNYDGPPEKFAMVVPVPVVLRKEDVRTLPREIFARLDRLTAPRLVEYWEQDPCEPGAGDEGTIGLGGLGLIGKGSGGSEVDRAGPQVRVEAQFAVGEYDIVVLSAEDALALERWLGDNGYVIPAGAAPYLQPYVASGSKFFVAKVDPKRVQFDAQGMATLSPLRVHYESEQFSLPIRLGLINAKGPQDLIVHILADGQRYEVANHPNVPLPTELLVKPEVRAQFPGFYAALFDGLLARHPGAVVTEYAWSARGCDPCPDEPLDSQELSTLGMDVLYGGMDAAPHPGVRAGALEVDGLLPGDIIRRILRAHTGELRLCYSEALAVDPAARAKFTIDFTLATDGSASKVAYVGESPPAGLDGCIVDAVKKWQFPHADAATKVRAPFTLQPESAAGQRPFVLTRLHARYDASTLGEDLVFRAAPPIANGSTGGDGPFVQAPVAARDNRFQGRFILRNPWTGPITCKTAIRGRWGAPPGGTPPPLTVTDAAFAPRGAIDAAALVLGTIEPSTVTPPEPAATKPVDMPPPSEPPPGPTTPAPATGCACRSDVPAGPALFIFLLLPLARRRSK